MAQIDFDKQNVSFRVTDTLHQLVDRLNVFEDRMVENRKLLDSNINDLLFMVHRDSGFITADSDLLITTENLTLETTNAFTTTSASFTSTTTGPTLFNSGGTISLASDQDLANVLLRSNGQTFGALRNKSGHLEIMSSLGTALTFSAGDAKFVGTITPPGGTLDTTAVDVVGAINEIHGELDSELSALDARVASNDDDIGLLQSQMTSTVNNTSDNTNRIAALEALNIQSRLNTIEAQIVQINNRLNILEL